MIWLLILLIFLIPIIIHFRTRYGRLGKLIDKIPGPKALPIIGNLLSFNIHPKKIWIMMHERQKEYPIFRIWSGIVPMVFTRDPDHVKIFLTSRKNINKDVSSYTNIKSFGNGLNVSTGKLWESRRKMFDQAFTFNMLEFYSKKMNVCSKRLITQLLSYERSYVHDVSILSEKISFEVACDAIMDYDVDAKREKKARKFYDAVESINKGSYYRIFHPYIQDWMLKFLAIGREQQNAWMNATNFCKEAIGERQKFHASSNLLKSYLDNINTMNDEEIRKTKKSLSVLDIMLLHEQQNLINMKDMEDESVLMVSVAFKTTSTALTFLMLTLAERKEVQDLARQELLDVLGDNKIITVQHVKQLEYLERCIKESLRLYTVLPYIGRSVDEEVKLGDYTIPVGTEMYFNIFQLHRDPELWSDPQKFDPDRFLPENSVNRHPFAYVPFARGPRNCIGQKFSMTEMKTVIAHILYDFYLEPIDFSADFELHSGLTLLQDKSRVKFVKIH